MCLWPFFSTLKYRQPRLNHRKTRMGIRGAFVANPSLPVFMIRLIQNYAAIIITDDIYLWSVAIASSFMFCSFDTFTEASATAVLSFYTVATPETPMAYLPLSKFLVLQYLFDPDITMRHLHFTGMHACLTIIDCKCGCAGWLQVWAGLKKSYS